MSGAYTGRANNGRLKINGEKKTVSTVIALPGNWRSIVNKCQWVRPKYEILLEGDYNTMTI